MHRLGSIGTGRDRTTDLDTGELLEEVEVEPGAPELAVGDAAHADRLDVMHGLGDGLVLHGALLGCRNRASGELLASVEHGLRTQQAADVIGSKRGIDRTHDSDCR